MNEALELLRTYGWPAVTAVGLAFVLWRREAYWSARVDRKDAEYRELAAAAATLGTTASNAELLAREREAQARRETDGHFAEVRATLARIEQGLGRLHE